MPELPAETEKERISQRLTFAFVTMGFDPDVDAQLAELAEALAVSTQQIELWTRGEELPALWQIAEIARHSGLSALWLLSAQGPMEATRVVEGLVLKTQNDELIGMVSPVESETVSSVIELANELNEATIGGHLNAATEQHVQQLVHSLRCLVERQAAAPMDRKSRHQYA